MPSPKLRYWGAFLVPEGVTEGSRGERVVGEYRRVPVACGLMGSPSPSVAEESGAVVPVSDKTFVIRYYPGVEQETWRFEFEGEQHVIEGIDIYREARRRGFLVLNCALASKRGVAQVPVRPDGAILLLEDGGAVLLEGGGRILLEDGDSQRAPGVLLEGGGNVLLESGGRLLLEGAA